MKTKLSLVIVALLAVSCASTQPMLCPACKDVGHFNHVKNEKLGEQKQEFVYTVNNQLRVKTYLVPVVAEKSHQWECSNGHRIMVAR